MIDRLTATLTIDDGAPVPVDDGSIALDQGWAPFATAELTLPAGGLEVPDPRGMHRGLLTVHQAWGESLLTLDDLSAAWAGLTLDDLSAEWAPYTLDDLSDLWGDRWGNAQWREPSERTFDLGLRRRVRDYVEDTWQLSLMSDERLAQETTLAAQSRPAEPLDTRFAVLLVGLGGLGTDVPVAIDLGAYANLTAPPLEVDWSMTAWDAVEKSATALGLRPWCDEHRVWRVSATSGGVSTIVHLPRVTSATETTDRDGDWSDLCRFVDVYTVAGAPAVSVLDLPDTSLEHRRMKTDVRSLGEVGSPPVIPARSPEPWAVTDLAAGRGRQLTLTAPVEPAVRPGIGLTTGLPSLPALSGQAERVVIDLGRAEMTITTRDTLGG